MLVSRHQSLWAIVAFLLIPSFPSFGAEVKPHIPSGLYRHEDKKWQPKFDLPPAPPPANPSSVPQQDTNSGVSPKPASSTKQQQGRAKYSPLVLTKKPRSTISKKAKQYPFEKAPSGRKNLPKQYLTGKKVRQNIKSPAKKPSFFDNYFETGRIKDVDGEYSYNEYLYTSAINTEILAASTKNPVSSVSAQMNLRNHRILQKDRLYIGGSLSFAGVLEQTDVDGVFPTINTYGTTDSTEAQAGHLILHNAGINATLLMGDWFLGAVNFNWKYEPKSDEEEIYIDKAHAVLGNTKEYPLFAAIGLGAVEFGRFHSVTPFSTTLNSDLFLTESDKIYLMIGFDTSAFRFTFTALPSGELRRGADIDAESGEYRNFALNVRGRSAIGDQVNIIAGAGFLRSSMYNSNTADISKNTDADDEIINASLSFFAGVEFEQGEVLFEYSTTRDPWPTTGDEVNAFTVQGIYTFNETIMEPTVSFSYGIASFGSSDENYDSVQKFVAGVSVTPTPHSMIAIEYIHDAGYVPLENIISNSNSDVTSHAVQFGGTFKF